MPKREKINRLNALGFYIELLPSIEPLFFVEKQGFSIKEALLLTRGRQQSRPNNEEIQSLQIDKESNILKLEYENVAFQENQSYTYIIILGPPNRGKTTFIFNIINKIFNVQYYSLYRVRKKQDETRRYYDEYFIQIQNKNYVFVDFRGIGDSKLDFLGLDYSGNSNIYIKILEYIQNKALAAIFYVNSSSINRLSEDESYCLQRFFELIPKSIINQNKFFLVLTYCTDNQPKMTIYEQSNSTPEDLKDLLRDSNLADQKKFWYGINNKPLYEPVIYFNGSVEVQNDKLDILIKNIGEDAFLTPEQNLNDGNQLGSDERNEDEEQREDQPEIQEAQLGKFQFNQMSKIIEEIIQKLQLLNNRQDNDAIDRKYFKNKLNFEKNIIELLIIYRLSTEGLELKDLENEQFQTTFLVYELRDSNERETFKIKQGSRLLLCETCKIKCHVNCRFNNTGEMVDDNNMCRMFVKRNGIFECKKCLKHGHNKGCQPKNHILVDRAGEINKKIQVSMIISNNYDQFKTKMSLNRKSKAIYRLQQTAAMKAKLNYQTKIDEIRDYMANNTKDNDCIAVDLHQRAKYLNAMMTQLKENNQNGDDFYKKLEEVNQIYQNFFLIDNTAQVPQQANIIPELDMDDQNVPQMDNNISFRQQFPDQNIINHENQFSQQMINGSPLKNPLFNSAYFNNANEQQPLISNQ
ncbi:unnamed protein product (macronuclear) [Paramecium tetraurelia]|uniref:Uncharacterized protein n=1 Tax=Paramecium tetraurelia TaxID=5888 RepID=A0BFL3_PARTE|nr:uncharacterized protein GSPATT00028365001 [Paramecium tetraurelia]CAK57330.1 unnamed protein product [Paramecium tetraurelia]|eukprot:XP_001424728.1 hypothetical protein (macronuclear) [Paramecium tetraurelia strain d4-2]